MNGAYWYWYCTRTARTGAGMLPVPTTHVANKYQQWQQYRKPLSKWYEKPKFHNNRNPAMSPVWGKAKNISHGIYSCECCLQQHGTAMTFKWPILLVSSQKSVGTNCVELVLHSTVPMQNGASTNRLASKYQQWLLVAEVSISVRHHQQFDVYGTVPVGDIFSFFAISQRFYSDSLKLLWHRRLPRHDNACARVLLLMQQ